MRRATGRALRVTLVNQFYVPDPAPTAHLTASLAEHLAARGHKVTVVTGGEGYLGARSGRAAGADGVRVVHLWTPALGKGTVVKRLSDYVSFLVGATLRMLTLRRQDVVVSLTTPPYVLLSAIAHRLVHPRARVVLWSMDCYPDVIERLGSRTGGGPGPHPVTAGRRERAVATVRRALTPLASLRQGFPLSRLLRTVNRWAFRRVDHVVALDDAMRDLLVDGYGDGPPGARRPPATVIPNWEAAAAFPADAAPEPWPGYADARLVGRFVVAYLGNLGYGHPVDAAVDAAARLAGSDNTADDDVAWLFLGGGARWEELRGKAEVAEVGDRVVQQGYVPKEATAGVMAGAGCALILLGDAALGVMSPSKLHANLAAGLPIVYVGPEGSNVDAAIVRYGCGVSVRTDDPQGLADAVRRLRDDPAWRAELSANARKAFEEAYCDTATLPRWDAVLGT